MAYTSLNLLNTDDLLTSEQLAIRDSVRSFINKEVLPKIQQHHRQETFPIELTTQLGELGLFGSSLEGYGCPGLDAISYGLMMQELERADSGLRSFCSVQGSLAMYAIWAFGSEEQKNKYLPRMALGEIIGCFGLTESDAGSDPGALLCRAKKTEKGFVINGNKMWITNGCISNLAIVWAKWNDKIHGFIVEKGSPGFTTSKMAGKFSLRMSVTSELHFEDCEISEAQLLPHAQGLKAPLACLNQARYGIAWGVLGAANDCYHTAINYIKERKVFGKSLAAYQLPQSKLVYMAQEITKAQLLVWQLGQLKQQGKVEPHQISLAKMNNCHIALECARLARDLLGANGIIDEYPIVRHMMNLEAVKTYEGTDDIHRLIVGMNITGQSAIR